jgi:hypothetical protein
VVLNVTDRKEGGWRADRQRENAYCDVSLPNNYLHTSSAHIARMSSRFLRLCSVVDWHAGFSFVVDLTVYSIHQLSGLLP